MARSEVGDIFQNCRFHVRAVGNNAEIVKPFTNVIQRNKNNYNPQSDGGFQSFSAPELSRDIVEYREGNAQWTAKFPGIPTVSDGTLMRGIVKTDRSFFDWILAADNGKEYRVDLEIYHFARDENPQTVDLSTVRTYKFFECFASRVKFGPDMESTGSEVSVTEVDFATETPDLQV